jgi:hypothetical protein
MDNVRSRTGRGYLGELSPCAVKRSVKASKFVFELVLAKHGPRCFPDRRTKKNDVPDAIPA